MPEEIKKAEPTNVPASRRVDPFAAMRSEMDRVFDGFLGRRWPDNPITFRDSANSIAMPSIDVRETETDIVVEAELPGMSEDDVDVTLSNGTLTIKGEKKSEREEKEDDYHLTERSYGRFQRSFRVPDTVDEDKIEAKLEKGVLHVTLAKRPEAVKAEKKIPIGGE
jgi:HSP20 family protein